MLYSILVKTGTEFEVFEADLNETDAEFAYNECLTQYEPDDIRLVKEVRVEVEKAKEVYGEDEEPSYVVRRIFYDE